MAEHEKKAEARLCDLQLSRDSDPMKWHFLLLRDDKTGDHFGLLMAPLVTKDGHPDVENGEAGLGKLFSCATNERAIDLPDSCTSK